MQPTGRFAVAAVNEANDVGTTIDSITGSRVEIEGRKAIPRGLCGKLLAGHETIILFDHHSKTNKLGIEYCGTLIEWTLAAFALGITEL